MPFLMPVHQTQTHFLPAALEHMAHQELTKGGAMSSKFPNNDGRPGKQAHHLSPLHLWYHAAYQRISLHIPTPMGPSSEEYINSTQLGTDKRQKKKYWGREGPLTRKPEGLTKTGSYFGVHVESQPEIVGI